MGKKATLYLVNVLIAIFTLIVAVLSFCAWLAGRVDPCEHWFIALTGLAMPALLVADAVLLVYWIVRLRLWAIVPLAVIVLNYGYLASVFQLHSSADPALPYDIKLATYNIDGFRKGAFGMTVEKTAVLMAEENVDIVCLQEFQISRRYGMDSIRNAFSFLPYLYAPLSSDREPHMAVFSKFPILDSGYLPFPETFNSSLWVDLSIEGKRVRLISNHLQTTSISQSRSEIEKLKQTDPAFIEENAQAALVLRERLHKNFCRRVGQVAVVRQIIDTTSGPLIVCGDFNDTPASYVYNRMKAGLNDGFKTSGRGYEYTYRGFWKMLRIDYILYNDALESVRYYSPPLEYSDHDPVFTELRFTAPPYTTERKN